MRFLDNTLHLRVPSSVGVEPELMVFGGLIIFFLIVEPHGLARIWQITQGKAAAVAVPALTVARSGERPRGIDSIGRLANSSPRRVDFAR